ncbi:MAG: response regulator [Janthinobacterium lividum]
MRLHSVAVTAIDAQPFWSPFALTLLHVSIPGGINLNPQRLLVPSVAHPTLLKRYLDALKNYASGRTAGFMQATVLLIDDNAVQAATRQTILKRAGYFVIPALNPERALQQFQQREFPAEIDLVITDHVMPGMNGSEFVRELRKIHPNIPVLVISGMDEAEEAYEGMNVVFRLKPLPPDHLLASVDRLVKPLQSDTEPAA